MSFVSSWQRIENKWKFSRMTAWEKFLKLWEPIDINFIEQLFGCWFCKANMCLLH